MCYNDATPDFGAKTAKRRLDTICICRVPKGTHCLLGIFFQPLKRLATVVWHLRRRWLSSMLYGMVVRQQMPRRGMTKVASQFIGWLLGSHENAFL